MTNLKPTPVVVHLDDQANVTLAQGNVHNLLTELPGSRVVVVVNGPAVRSFLTPSWRAFLTALPEVEVDACANALRANGILAEQLPAGVTVVPAGVARIVELEQQGFAYLKP
ncbi:DsrE family protein [Levilactobacillus zymae]|uniref:DsrE family protein n=1 Tax=Levilactobacillus zymae TaxID=267363 RepID=UPI000B402002|nr:DsrE family protein [Levilactobacillus zymae]